MKYDYFIGMVKNYETTRIKAFRGENRTTVERIPDAFALLFPEIFKILERNIDQLCNSAEGIVIFGLQPAGSMIASSQPDELNRKIKGFQPDYHFCCSMEYQVAPLENIEQTEQWENTRSVVIDFTSGNIMDPDQYVEWVAKQPIRQGTVLGRINSYALAIVWSIINLKQNPPNPPE